MKADPPAPDDNTCDRCGGVMELVTHIPRRLGRPPCAIFTCLDCGDVQWKTLGEDESSREQ
jgi:hypothetical protein